MDVASVLAALATAPPDLPVYIHTSDDEYAPVEFAQDYIIDRVEVRRDKVLIVMP